MSDPRGGPTPDDERTPRTERQAKLEEIVADYLLRKEDGEPVTVDDYLVRYPRYAEELAGLLTDGSLTATPWLLPKTSREAMRVGPFEIVSHVASGGGGTVYEARDLRHGHRVALKILDRLAVTDPRDFARFDREAAILRELDLVNVVPVLDTGEDQGRLYIAMRWIDGGTLGSLRDAVRDPTHRLHDFKERVRLIARVARALEVAHGRGILHRDVKPSNILVDRLFEPVLIDFGISARERSETLTRTQDGPLGTPRYLPPELLMDPQARPSAGGDVYGLGLCLYELICGVPAFVQKRRSDLYEQMTRSGILPPRAVDPLIPVDLEAIIVRACDRFPAHRHDSMSSLAQDLEAYARGLPVSEATKRRARFVTSFFYQKRRALSFVAAALVVVLLALAAAWGPMRTAYEDRQTQSLTEALGAWRLAPRELTPIQEGSTLAMARALAERPRLSTEQRLSASWAAYLAGAPEDALAMLSGDRNDDGRAEHLLRALIQCRLDTLERVKVRSDLELSSDEEEQYQQILRLPPRPEQLEEWFANAPVRKEAIDDRVELLVRWETLPTDLSPERAGQLVEPLLELCGRTLDLPGEASRFVRALIRLHYGPEPQSAIDDTVVLHRLHPDLAVVSHLHGLALRAAGRHAEAVPILEVAMRGFVARPFGHDCTRGHLILSLIELERWDDARRYLAAWPRSSSWQDAVLPLLVGARLEDRRGDERTAIELLNQAHKAQTGFALPVQMAADLRARQGDQATVRRLLEFVRTAPIKEPRTLEDAFRWNFLGLRPDCGRRFRLPWDR